jgi:plasmid stabilization system protein ParE
MAAIERIAEFPAAWQRVDAELRRCQLDRFPYGLVYLQEDSEILVVAVTHLQQRPRTWQARLRNKD